MNTNSRDASVTSVVVQHPFKLPVSGANHEYQFKFSFQKPQTFSESSQNKENYPIPPGFAIQQNPNWQIHTKPSVFLQKQNTQIKCNFEKKLPSFGQQRN